MENDYFTYKSHCELTIVSDEISPESITEELGVLPTRAFKKGDQSVSKHSGSIVSKPYNLWALISNVYTSKEEDISCHMDFFKSVLSEKLNILEKYKCGPLYEVTFSIWVETDNAGIGLDLDEKQMAFLSSISNRTRWVFIAKNYNEKTQ